MTWILLAPILYLAAETILACTAQARDNAARRRARRGHPSGRGL